MRECSERVCVCVRKSESVARARFLSLWWRVECGRLRLSWLVPGESSTNEDFLQVG